MSAANRGAPRVGLDNYPTPAWCTRRILEVLDLQKSGAPFVLEPCVGEGAIAEAVSAYYDLRCMIVGSDIRETAWASGGFDATRDLELGSVHSAGRTFDLLITNPPFSLAADIIVAQRDTARVCAYLLRSSFKLEGELANGEPYSFRNDMPSEFRLPERPQFIASDHCVGGDIPDGAGGVIHALPCGWAQKVALTTPKPGACPACGNSVRRSTSDASEYSWYVWDTDRRSKGSVVLLPSTPLVERSAKAAARAAKKAAQ